MSLGFSLQRGEEQDRPIEIGDSDGNAGNEVSIEYPRSPSIPSLTYAVSNMLDSLPGMDEPRDFENEQWPSEDHCLSLLAKQINGVVRRAEGGRRTRAAVAGRRAHFVSPTTAGGRPGGRGERPALSGAARPPSLPQPRH